MTDRPHDEPSEVTVEDGQVVVDGPGAVAITMTPAAAIETAERLHAAAVVALGHLSASGS